MKIAATATLLGCSLMGATVTAADDGLRVGDRFPDLVLPALDDGRPLRVSDFRGQKLILHVFASW